MCKERERELFMGTLTFERYRVMCRFLHQWELSGVVAPDGSLIIGQLDPNRPGFTSMLEQMGCCPICKESPVHSQKIATQEWEDM